MSDWQNYLRDNPRRLWVKRNHSDLFVARSGITIGDTAVTVMGNRFLLDYPYKVQVKCSRSFSDVDIEAACRRYMAAAEDGAVLVSPCISRGEKEVMKRVFAAGMPQIYLLENGFSPMQKPYGRQFDACSAGRLLLVAPWEHHNEWLSVTRQQCLELNALAERICAGNTLR